MSGVNKVWEEKYRPKTMDEILVDPAIKQKILDYRKDGEIPNILFCGPPGQGKTSLAKILVNDVLDCQYIYINASDENGIDTIRSKVSNFAQTKSIDGKVKVVILDEADFLTAQGQGALRNTMEEYLDICRFILTANIRHKISPAIQSRCTPFDIVPPLRDSAIRCFNILKAEGIDPTSEEKGQIVELVKAYHPDMRKAIKALQRSVVGGKLDIRVGVGIDSKFVGELLKLAVSKRALEARKLMIENESTFNGDYPQLLKELLNVVFANADKMNDSQVSSICLTIADHMYKSNIVADQEINCFSCLLQIQQAK